MIKIGLMDVEILSGKKYMYPNFDLCVTYTYLKQNLDNSVHLITSTSAANLSKYDKIYAFKMYRHTKHPVTFIPNYYKYPIEEYGPGFINRPLRPFLLETREILCDGKCYNPILQFSIENRFHPSAWHISKGAIKGKYTPIRLYERFEGEELKRDMPVTKWCLIYDKPSDIINNNEKMSLYLMLRKRKIQMKFAQPLDVSLVHDTKLLEQVLTNRAYAPLRHKVIATQLNGSFVYYLNLKREKRSESYIHIITPRTHKLEFMLTLIRYRYNSNYVMRLYPVLREAPEQEPHLVRLAYQYLITSKARWVSFYEYVLHYSFIYQYHIPLQKIVVVGEKDVEHMLNEYGMPYLLKDLESFIRSHPMYEESIFLGGKSKYEKQRRKYYDKGRSGFNIEPSTNNTSA